jgi:hypothetical protein
MLNSKILRAKKVFLTAVNESIIDLISSTFKFSDSPTSAGIAVVGEFEIMRPDLVSEKFYSTQENWDLILKYNGISNPFSLDSGETLVMPPFTAISSLVTPPREVTEKGVEPAKRSEDLLLTPKTKVDKKRLESIRKSTPEVVPPNVNLSGVKNVKVVNGEVIVGANMTQNTTSDQNQSATRSRVQNQLNNNIF